MKTKNRFWIAIALILAIAIPAGAQTVGFSHQFDLNNNRVIDPTDQALSNAYFASNMGQIAPGLKTATARAATRTAPTATLVPATATAIPLPTLTATSVPAPTVTSTPIVIPMATDTPMSHPTAIPQGTMPAPGSLFGQPCPAIVHDQFKVIRGGQMWPTWHPKIDPTTKCTFDHEHGDDPVSSLADVSQPAFGYVVSLVPGHVHGTGESSEAAHAGFKVFVVNKGETNDEGRTSKVHLRTVVHMGTSLQARSGVQFHSLEFDMIAPDTGEEVHVEGMADFAKAGSICQRDAGQGIGRTLPFTSDSDVQAACSANSSYEIWQGTILIDAPSVNQHEDGALRVFASPAVFDPVVEFTDSSMANVRVTGEKGCDREAYQGPVYFGSYGSGIAEVYTDVYGKEVPNGPLKQRFTMKQAVGIPFNQDQTLMKMRKNHCYPGIGNAN